ncbi:hypothetical protein LIA77_10896 [Sarocladium implicatum]|nr:hypothetical protein LIA77_10896 [Sarocladium implicatum]
MSRPSDSSPVTHLHLPSGAVGKTHIHHRDVCPIRYPGVMTSRCATSYLSRKLQSSPAAGMLGLQRSAHLHPRRCDGVKGSSSCRSLFSAPFWGDPGVQPGHRIQATGGPLQPQHTLQATGALAPATDAPQASQASSFQVPVSSRFQLWASSSSSSSSITAELVPVRPSLSHSPTHPQAALSRGAALALLSHLVAVAAADTAGTRALALPPLPAFPRPLFFSPSLSWIFHRIFPSSISPGLSSNFHRVSILQLGIAAFYTPLLHSAHFHARPPPTTTTTPCLLARESKKRRRSWSPSLRTARVRRKRSKYSLDYLLHFTCDFIIPLGCCRNTP